ncbi:hypothetical protein SMALB_8076 [Streptomyces malaysiensis]|uniref:Uncharacterized protein n=1 Tax=Streptomyces malaysiensis TaxID=92644 RepID=A0A7X5XB15_STRMQ|nr:hypothetical protein [Streptomyces malaysiensis]
MEGQPVGADLADDDAAAGRAEVYGGEAVFCGGHVDLVVGCVGGCRGSYGAGAGAPGAGPWTVYLRRRRL